MVYGAPCPWYIDTPTHGILTPIHGIKTHLTMVFWPPTNGIWSPIPMVYQPTTHGILTPPTNGILTPYPWYLDPLPMEFWSPTHGTSTPLSMVFWPPTHDISNPLPMVCWPPAYLLIRNEGGQNTMGVQFTIQGGQNTIWHRSFLHSWPITGFVIRLTRRVPLVEQEQITFPEHPSSVPVFNGVCVTRSLVLCVCFVDHCLSFCPILPLCCPSFDLRILITPFGFGILKLFLRKAVLHFPIGSYVKHCHVSGS
jgi:hypothetical protein